MEDVDQEEMYRAYARPVYCFLLSLCHSRQIAEELTAETFYQAIKSIKRYDGSCELKTWLFQIAKNAWRKEARRLHRAAETVSLEEGESPGSVEEAVEDTAARIAFYKAVTQLDEPYRTVVFLRLASNLSFDEIGEILGRSGNWARVSYYRAKERLKRNHEE